MLMVLAVVPASSKLSETPAFRTKLLNPTPPKLSNQQVLLPPRRELLAGEEALHCPPLQAPTAGTAEALMPQLGPSHSLPMLSSTALGLLHRQSLGEEALASVFSQASPTVTPGPAQHQRAAQGDRHCMLLRACTWN